MYAKKFMETKFEKYYGCEYYRILPKEVAEKFELSLVKIKNGLSVPKHVHKNEDQAYIILSGKGIMRVNEEEKPVEGGMIVYIPHNSEHTIKNVGEDELAYIYVANWLI